MRWENKPRLQHFNGRYSPGPVKGTAYRCGFRVESGLDLLAFATSTSAWHMLAAGWITASRAGFRMSSENWKVTAETIPIISWLDFRVE
jgi:hypothetical protein